MRKEVFVAAFLLMAISFVSSSGYYNCSDGNLSIYSFHSVKLGESVDLAGLKLGLVSSREDAIIFLSDAKTFILTNSTVQNASLVDGTKYTVSLVKSDDISAEIKINAENKTIGEGNTEKFSKNRAYLANAGGQYPGTANVKVIVGKDEIFLTDKGPQQITFNKTEYVIELYGGSETGANIKVDRCVNRSTKINVTQYNITSVYNTSVINKTKTINQTNTTNSTINSTVNQTNSTDNEVKIPETKTARMIRYGIYIVFGITAIVVIFFVAKYMKNRKYQEMPTSANSAISP